MAEVARQLRAITATSFAETIRRKMFYLIGVLTVLIVISMAAAQGTVSMATKAGETGVVTEIHTDMVQQAIGIWSVASLFLALYLGAVSFSSEIAAKTLVNVLSRPVDRATYLVGRWFGVLAFIIGFQLIGVLGAVAIARSTHTVFSPLFWYGSAQSMSNLVLMSGIALGLSVVLPPFVSGVLALIVTNLAAMAGDWLHSSTWIVKVLAYAAHYLGPAQMPGDLTADSFNRTIVHPPYSLYAAVLAENVLYAAVFFLIMTEVLRRKELRLR